MITLNTLSQITDSLAPTEEEIKAPTTASPDDGVNISSRSTFDAVLSQALVPYQPISLSPTAVEEVIAAFDAKGTIGTNEADDHADLTMSADEKNQQLLDALLQIQPKHVSSMAAKPVLQGQAFPSLISEGEKPAPQAAVTLSDSVPVSLSTPERS